VRIRLPFFAVDRNGLKLDKRQKESPPGRGQGWVKRRYIRETW